MTRPFVRSFPGVLVAVVFPILALALPTAGWAQETSGPLLKKGQIRLEFLPSFFSANERFGERTEGGSVVKRTEPLGFDFTFPQIGSTEFPEFADLELALGQALPTSMIPSVVLGSSGVIVTKTSVRIPIRLDVGVLPWLTVGGMIPFSKQRTEISSSFRSDSSNVGANLQSTDPAIVTAFLDGFAASLVALQGVVTTLCAGAGAGTQPCLDATTLFNDATAFSGGLGAAFLTSSVFPLASSTTGTALQTRLDAFSTSFAALGVTSLPVGVPLPTAPVDQRFFEDLARNPGVGPPGISIDGFTGPWEMGDAEIFANARIGEWLAPRDPSTGARLGRDLMLGVGILARLPTGTINATGSPFVVTSGSGHTDIELRFFGNLQTSGRLGVFTDLRYGLQGSTDVTARVTAPENELLPSVPRETLAWQPGNYLSLRVTPRIQMTREVALAFEFSHWSKGSDEFAILGATGSDASLLELETEESRQDFGIGVVFSTIELWKLGVVEHPTEFRFLFRTAISGSGGRTLKGSRIQFGARWFRELF